MRIAIYSPYLDTVGGGEKYMMTIAETFSSHEEVDVLLDTHLQSMDIETIKAKLKKLHRLDLEGVKFIKAPIGAGTTTKQRLKFFRQYDWLIALTDGSIFLSTAKKSLLHFQVPFENSHSYNPWTYIKIKSWKGAIFNSQFSKKIVEQNWPIKGPVLYPPVSIDEFKVLPKKNQIITVGRFFGFLKDKKQEFMIETFKKLSDQGQLPDWTFHLVGAAAEGDMDYVADLKKQAQGYKIQIHPNLAFSDLIKLYGESKIYWHASGFGETDPKKFEHFGITTVEAMASGCVPVVINKGGQKEIVSSDDGLLWDNQVQFIDMTLEVACDKELWLKYSKQAIARSKDFSKQKFCEEIKKIIYEK